MDAPGDGAMTMTPGKQRGLDTLATVEGVFAILAIDHRDSLRAVLPGEPGDLAAVRTDQIWMIGPLPRSSMSSSRTKSHDDFPIPVSIDSSEVSRVFLPLLERKVRCVGGVVLAVSRLAG